MVIIFVNYEFFKGEVFNWLDYLDGIRLFLWFCDEVGFLVFGFFLLLLSLSLGLLRFFYVVFWNFVR